MKIHLTSNEAQTIADALSLLAAQCLTQAANVAREGAGESISITQVNDTDAQIQRLHNQRNDILEIRTRIMTH